METSNSPLLDRLMENPVTPGPGRLDFITALKRLNITDVVAIAALPKAQFIKELARFNDDDGAQAYDKALSFTTQLQWLCDQQQFTVDPALKRSKRELGSPYSSLLEENWEDVCDPHAIAAVDSPVAYLRTLYLFAMHLENKGAPNEKRIPLGVRRPDLQNLLIDHDATFRQRPMLSIIDDVLREQIRQHQPGQDLHLLLSEQHYPLTQPYHHHHYQCRLGLSGTGYGPGELNHRIGKRAPLNAADSATQADVVSRNDDAQCLLSELNPTQQSLLRQPPLDAVALLATHFNWSQPPGAGETVFPTRIDPLLRCTGLDSVQLQALLAQNSFAPHASPSAKGQTLANFGARYINGSGAIPMAVATVDNVTTLLHGSAERFDRMQRMIRLHNGCGLSFCELDTLIVSARACEANTANPSSLNHNTLRVLGVYRYLSRRYSLSPLEFCAWLDQLPVQASANEQPLFDQVFNRNPVAEQPLPLDGEPFDAPTRQHLCQALGLTDTPDSLELLLGAAPPRRDLATYSSIYRQAHIPKVFGLSALHCKQLADLLGPATWSLLTTPRLRANGEASIDVLDVLMQLDWAVTWLKDNHTSVPQLRQQLLAEPIIDNPTLARLTDSLQASLSKLPPTDGDSPTTEQWIQLQTSPVPARDAHALFLMYSSFLKITAAAPLQRLTLHHLILLGKDIASLLALPVSNATLHALLLNPRWLDSKNLPNGVIELNLGTVYFLRRFRDFCDNHDLAQETLLEYFRHANTKAAGARTPSLTAQLSHWLGWSETELEALAMTLPHGMVRSMDELDWIMRCRQACARTRLSSQTLLDACELNIASPFSQWKSVGEAVIGAHQ